MGIRVGISFLKVRGVRGVMKEPPLTSGNCKLAENEQENGLKSLQFN